MGAMAMGKSLYFVTSMLLCAPLHGLKFVLSTFFIKVSVIVTAEFVAGAARSAGRELTIARAAMGRGEADRTV